MKKLYAALLALTTLALHAQVEVQSQSFTIERVTDFNPRSTPPSFSARIISLEAPDAMSHKGFINAQKVKGAALYPAVESSVSSFKSTTPQPSIGWTSDMYRVYPSVGITAPLYGGIPNDNTLAYSKDGIMLAAVNTFLWAYDLDADTVHMDGSFVDLDAIGPDAAGDRGFDPKLYYDAELDRFILVFLKNNDPATSKITVCFSSTNDPNDPWYTYILPGNPLNNNRWTDFPAFSVTDDHVFITANLIIPNVSWQVGFDGSIIWQLDKDAGFAGDTTIPNRLYHDIRYGGRYIRNLHAVRGYNGRIDTAYFLSNRNFDLQNDSIFVLSVHSDIGGTEDLRIRMHQTDVPYGMPPNGRQVDTDVNDPTDGLQTNDARVLAAIRMPDGHIQYVSNTRNFTTGRANIYHGFVYNPGGNTTITGNLIGDPIKDYGYANLAWTGNEECDNEVIISFNHTSPSHFAGVSAIYYANDGSYSDVLTIKTGENYVSRLVGGDRWGDYFGIQTDYSHPGRVFTAGFYGTQNRSNSAYFAELTSPDSSKLSVSVSHIPGSSRCNQVVELTASGGVAPYSYSWNGTGGSSSITACGDDTLLFSIIDSRGCIYSGEYAVPNTLPDTEMVYPNPTTGRLSVVFDAPADGDVQVLLSDIGGKEVWVVTEGTISAGKNYLEYDLDPVVNGIYILNVIQGEEIIYTERIVKQ